MSGDGEGMLPEWPGVFRRVAKLRDVIYLFMETRKHKYRFDRSLGCISAGAGVQLSSPEMETF